MQKAKDRYEAAQGQLVNRVYTNEKGWVWEADSQEVEDSKQELEDLEAEIARDAAINAIDDEIEKLEELKDKWDEYPDKIKVSFEELGYSIDENKNIVLNNGNDVINIFNGMTGSANDYATGVKNATTSVANSINSIPNLTLSSPTGVSTEWSAEITKIIESIKLLEAELENYRNIMYHSQLTTTLSFLEMSEAILPYKADIAEMNNMFISEISEMQTSIDSLNFDNISNNILNMKDILDTIVSSFANINSEISAFSTTLANTSNNSAVEFERMSNSSMAFSDAISNVEQTVTNSLSNIENVANSAMLASDLAKTSAIEAEEASLKAWEFAQKANEYATEAQSYAEDAEDAADRAEKAASSVSSSQHENPLTGVKIPSRANGIEGGNIDFTGLTMLHGSPSNPEWVLTNTQMQNFVKNMSRNRPEISTSNSNVSENDSLLIQNCTFPLNNVNNATDFISEMKQIARQNRR